MTRMEHFQLNEDSKVSGRKSAAQFWCCYGVTETMSPKGVSVIILMMYILMVEVS